LLKVPDFVDQRIIYRTIDEIVKYAQKQGLCGEQRTRGGTPAKFSTAVIKGEEKNLNFRDSIV
jgi:hypothetical protein